MLTFKELINEKFVNLFKDEEKENYKDEVWNLLQISYASLGGIKGNGFKSPDDMIKNIKMWKIQKNNGKIIAGVMYKDKNYRKAVAVFTDGSKSGKESLKQILKDDLKRSVIEVSHSLLKFLEKKLPSFVDRYKIPCEKVKEYLPNDEIDCENKYYYTRKIGSEEIRKLMLGTKINFK